MSAFADQVRSTLLERGLLLRGESVLLAVSGGLDSMTLLHVLHELAPDVGWKLSIAHFNHQLRGRSSDADERLVRGTARRLRIPFRAGRVDVRKLAERSGISVEMAAREARHRFLARTARALGIRKIALAHHADDQVELIFLRFLRGAGLEGLAGMRFIGPSPADANLQLIRPMLGFARSEIESAAREHGVRYRVDVTNASLDYERNWIRHQLLPSLRERFCPGLDKNIMRLGEIVAAESEFVAACTRQAMIEGGAEFEECNIALQRRWLRSECLRLGLAADFELVESLRTKPGQPLSIDVQHTTYRDRAGKVHLRKLARPRFQRGHLSIDLRSGRGQAEFGGCRIVWESKPWMGWPTGRPVTEPFHERFDADRVGSAVRLRHWRPGDRFQPIGLPASVKLQDLFVNAKIPKEKRRTLILAETEAGEIFWVEGLRMSERFKIDEKTRRCLHWHWQHAPSTSSKA